MLETKKIYDSSIPATTELAEQYNKSKHSNWRYLAYRDLGELFKKYVTGNEVLDYGSGTGISTDFLLSNGFKVDGVDVNENMLAIAKTNLPNVNFQLINPYTIFARNKYDLIFSSFVLDEIPSMEKMILYFKIAKIALKREGMFVAVTGNAAITKNDFLTIVIESNISRKSGDMHKTYMREFNIEFNDYYWTAEDFQQAFITAGLELKEQHFPLGKQTDNIPWRDELYESPYIILVGGAT